MGKSSKKHSKSKAKRKSRNPDKPKKPPTSYVLYCSHARPELKEKCPTATFAEFNKMLGEQWSKLPESEKKMFFQKAAALKAEYQTQQAAYKAKHPDSDEDTGRGKKKKKKKKKDERAPKKPLTAYFFFQADVRGKIREENPTLQVKDIARVVASQWGALTEDQKKPYEKMAAKDKERYAREKTAYQDLLDEEKKAKRRQESSSSESESSSSSSSSGGSSDSSDSD